MSIETNDIQGSYMAIGYKGNPEETNMVKTTELKAALMASHIFKGSYTQMQNTLEMCFVEM